ncbi:hypothetical protein EJB05_06364, partial [Eragrostis curvula]
MVLSNAAPESNSTTSSALLSALPWHRMPEQSMPKEAAYEMIREELKLDGSPLMNLASFTATWMEPECDQLIMAAVNKNYINMDPITTQLHNRCVNMIARLFHAPLGELEEAVGVGTVGSSEAIMLAGLAMKRRWQNKRAGPKASRTTSPTSSLVCWKKFASYFEVELREVKLRDGYYVMDPKKAVAMVDENTIGVAAILGSTLNGEFEDVKLLNDLLDKKNRATGWGTPIHVDAASGGFVAPFLYPALKWDFRLPLVRSINVSGHKYGLVYPGIGWCIWRTKEDLPEELVFHINYVADECQPMFTLNFSKGSGQVIAQYYQLVRHGFDGYRKIMQACRENAMVLEDGIRKTGRFDVVSKGDGVPLVAFSLKDCGFGYDAFGVSDMLRRRFGWIVPAYAMPPDAQHVTVLRVVVRA